MHGRCAPISSDASQFVKIIYTSIDADAYGLPQVCLDEQNISGKRWEKNLNGS